MILLYISGPNVLSCSVSVRELAWDACTVCMDMLFGMCVGVGVMNGVKGSLGSWNWFVRNHLTLSSHCVCVRACVRGPFVAGMTRLSSHKSQKCLASSPSVVVETVPSLASTC